MNDLTPVQTAMKARRIKTLEQLRDIAEGRIQAEASFHSRFKTQGAACLSTACWLRGVRDFSGFEYPYIADCMGVSLKLLLDIDSRSVLISVQQLTAVDGLLTRHFGHSLREYLDYMRAKHVLENVDLSRL